MTYTKDIFFDDLDEKIQGEILYQLEKHGISLPEQLDWDTEPIACIMIDDETVISAAIVAKLPEKI